MYIRLKSSKKAKHPTMQIVEGYRENGKVRQRTIAHLGVIRGKEDLKRVKGLANAMLRYLEQHGVEGDPKVTLDQLKHKATVYSGFREVVATLMEQTGLAPIIRSAQGKRHTDLAEIVQLLIAQRFAAPGSKRRAHQQQGDYGFQNIELQTIYRAMDAIAPLSDIIQKQMFLEAGKLSEGQVDCLFFDVTTLYFESITQDDLREFGYSKDQKYHSVQIVLALVVDANGIPLAYDTFKGNLAETRTLIPVLTKLRQRLSIANITVICDRGMASRQNIAALQEAGFHFVVASKLKTMSKKLQLNALDQYTLLPDQDNVPESEKIRVRVLDHPQYPDTQLIITHSPARARKDQFDRERLVKKLRNRLSDEPDETSIKQVISNTGYKRYTEVRSGSSIALNEQAVEEDAEWDGFHGLAVSNSARLNINQALSRYRELWRVEEAFRVAKSTLQTRPVFHWLPGRIQSHVLLCFISLFLERYLETQLRQKGTPLTPDRIRNALDHIHTIHIQDAATGRKGCLQSELTVDAKTIYRNLNLEESRSTVLNETCCA